MQTTPPTITGIAAQAYARLYSLSPVFILVNNNNVRKISREVAGLQPI